MKNSISPKLKSILEKGENSKVELKESVRSGLDRTIVAFANSSGGEIYIGITDKGKVKGINITNRLKGQIETIARNCDPKVSISIKEMAKEKVLLIVVKESKNKPHRCSAGFYIRSGSTSQKLSTEEIIDFGIREGKARFDTQVCKKFDYKKHFDKEKLFSFLNRSKVTYNRRNIVQLLENLGVAQRQGSKVTINNAGALFFSKDLQKIHSHAEIACVLFRGKERGKIIDSGRFNKDLRANI